jgi:uncharacterized protein YoxC
MMFCKKAFLQERKDIGIYKSLGFTSTKLRLQFAVRFLIVSLIGSAFGAVLSVLFTQPILTATFRILGVSVFNAQFTVMSFVIPILIVAVSFFVFSFFASRKIKKVEIKELVVAHRNEVETLNNTIEELKCNVNTLRDDQEKLMKMNAELKAEIGSQGESLERAKKEIRFHIKEKNKIEREVEGLSKSYTELKVENDKMNRLTHGKFRKGKKAVSQEKIK